MKRICIIGAGAAGLCAARNCLAKQWNVVLYEQTSQIGGTWVYVNNNCSVATGSDVHSSMYKNLK